MRNFAYRTKTNNYNHFNKQDYNMKKIFTLMLALAAIMPMKAAGLSEHDANNVIGWAAVGKTTGSQDKNEITVTTFADLQKALNTSGARTIYISGEITMEKRLYVKNGNLTIYGLPGSKLVNPKNTKKEYNNSGVLYFQDAKNVIFRNVVFSCGGAFDVGGYDCLCLESCSNFWIDHCEFYDGMDGNIDIVEGSDCITFTWCKFGYNLPPQSTGKEEAADHRFSNLIGNNDGMSSDNGHMRVTFSNCWWAEGCVERMPRVRFGKVHVANCLYSSSVTQYCFGVGYMSKIYAENNAFVSDAAKSHIWKYPNEKAKEAHHFKLVNSLGAADVDLAKGTETHFNPSTAYSDVAVYAPDLVESTVTTFGGATLTEEQLKTRGNKPTAVEVVEASAEAKNVEYYTLDGIKIADPQNYKGLLKKRVKK
jgi:pectate lyase